MPVPHAPTPYDQVLYRSGSFPQTHPDRLATLATLFGLDPAPPARCRVLEVGCGEGSNLLAMAQGLPESTFVGFDYAARPVALGREMAAEAGLDNVTLEQHDLMALPEDYGTFDYIIAHGFYSWVPAPARDRLMAAFRQHLAPQGVAYVSYNTMPGGYLRQMTRSMMRFHIQHLNDPQERVRQARAFFNWLREAQQPGSWYHHVLEREARHVGRSTDEHLYHDHLADVNDAFFFHQVAEHAARHGLQYLAEADYSTMNERAFPPPVAEQLQAMAANPVVKEQYMDFLRGRTFRQTLFCHAAHTLHRTQRPAQVHGFHVAAPMSWTEPDAAGALRFTGYKKRQIQTGHPLAQRVLQHVGAAWPRYVPFEALAEAVHDDEQAEVLDALVLSLYADGIIDLHLHAPAVATTVPEKPTASPVARAQARRQEAVSSLGHDVVVLTEKHDRALLTLLDGTRDHGTLLYDWNAALEAGAPATPEALTRTLETFARQGLLLPASHA